MEAGMRTAASPAPDALSQGAPDGLRQCCSRYHRAVELVGKRWTGAILLVLLEGPLRFCEITQVVPALSDRLLSERLKELEAEDIVERRVYDGSPVRVEYSLTEKGRALEPALRALKSWSHSYL
jgi:DNA-binding HxlR family transcriptional regulator